MSRKSRTNLATPEAQNKLLQEVYNDAFSIKVLSSSIIKNLANKLDYENKEEIERLLPLVQKQIDIINNANANMLDIQNRLNG